MTTAPLATPPHPCSRTTTSAPGLPTVYIFPRPFLYNVPTTTPPPPRSTTFARALFVHIFASLFSVFSTVVCPFSDLPDSPLCSPPLAATSRSPGGGGGAWWGVFCFISYSFQIGLCVLRTGISKFTFLPRDRAARSNGPYPKLLPSFGEGFID